MRWPRPSSIRSRLFGLAGAVSTLTVAIAGTLFILNDLSMLRQQMVRDLEVLAVVIGDNCLAALEFDAPQTAERNLASLRREYQIRVAALYGARGRLFATYRRDADQPLSALPRSDDGVVVVTPLLGLGRVEVLRTLYLDGQPIGRIIIQARTDELAAQRYRYALIAAGLLVTTLSLSLLLAWWWQRRISAPILGLATKTEEISNEGEYGTRVSRPPASFAEIDTLVNGLNQLLGAIQVRESELKAHADALDAANNRLRTLATEISLVEERERKRLATELHDSAMQKLAIARLQIAGVAEGPALAMEAAHDERLDVGLALIREVLGELRSLQFELSPPSLYLGGLPQALESLATHIRTRCGIAIDYVELGEVPQPPLELAVETAAGIRTASPATRIIALSMYADDHYLQRMLAAGARAYVLKGEASSDLFNAIRAVLQGETFVSPSLSQDGRRAVQRAAEVDQTSLSDREREVLRRLAQGQRNKEIAIHLGISDRTVETYRNRLMHKLKVNNLADLVRFAIQAGIAPRE